MRRAAKVDTNQAEIVQDLRALGCTVQSIASMGQGVPDLLVGWKGKNYLFEVKDPAKPPSKRLLTEDELSWQLAWRGHVKTIEGTYQALEEMTHEG